MVCVRSKGCFIILYYIKQNTSLFHFKIVLSLCQIVFSSMQSSLVLLCSRIASLFWTLLVPDPSACLPLVCGLFLCTRCGFYDPVWTINCWTVSTLVSVCVVFGSNLTPITLWVRLLTDSWNMYLCIVLFPCSLRCWMFSRHAYCIVDKIVL